MNGFRIFDKQENKYIKGLFLDENGKICTLRRIDFDIKASEELDPERYIVEMSTGDNLFINDVFKDSCLVKGTKNGYTGNFSAEVERVVFYNDIEKRYELKAIRMTVDESIKNPHFDLEKYSLPFIPKDIKATSNIHEVKQ